MNRFPLGWTMLGIAIGLGLIAICNLIRGAIY